LTKKTNQKKIFNDSAFGWDGLSTFIFSNIILILTFGCFFFYLLFKTVQTAIVSKTNTKLPLHAILVAGLCLKNNQPSEEYKIRLRRLIRLLETHNKPTHIIILGGITGNNSHSEAQAGAHYLIHKGIDSNVITLEDQSRHTLENLQNARSILGQQLPQKKPHEKAQSIAIISSRYHLYRIFTLAQGMNMTLLAIASEETASFSTTFCLRLLKEAYFIHWYWSGKLWVWLSGNKKSKRRIS
jgi:uncharacterized SAM-binding protein YcdF (DUF218 family)